MLQLITKEIDIAKISKLLAKHGTNVSVANGVISLDDEISEELIAALCSEVNIMSVEKRNEGWKRDNFEVLYRGDCQIIDKTQNYDLKYPTVKRGEIYLCDCGNGYGSEIMGIRFALVMQNDIANTCSPTTIVIPVTSKISNRSNVYSIVFSENTLTDIAPSSAIKHTQASFLCAQIKTVDKKRLRNYIGTLRSEVLEKIEERLKSVLQLNGEIR